MSGTQILTTPIPMPGTLNVGTALSITGGALDVVTNAANGVLGLDTSGNVANANLGVNILVASNIAALKGLASTHFPTGSSQGWIRTNEYGAGTGVGGGDFNWEPGSSTQPDGAIVIVPTDRTTPGSASLGTGSGTAGTTYSLNFGKTAINPGTISISCTIGGAAATIIDVPGYGAAANSGYLILSTGGMPIGTCNYAAGTGFIGYSSTGGLVAEACPYLSSTLGAISLPAWNTVPTISGAITSTFSYVNSAGRFIKVIGSSVSVEDFGATAAATDIWRSLAAADAYAANNAKQLTFQGGTYNLVTPFVSYCLIVWAPAVTIKFVPASGWGDLLPAWTVNSGGYIQNISISGVNLNFSTAEMNNWVNTTTSSPSCVGDLSLPTTRTPYSAFAAGYVAFMAGLYSQPIFENCSADHVKFGLVYNNGGGHLVEKDCAFGGTDVMAARYILCNSEDFFIIGGGSSGGFCCTLYGDYFYSGHYGGFAVTMLRHHHYGNPYAFFQCTNNPTSTTGVAVAGLYATRIEGCSLEQTGEAAFRQLSNAAWDAVLDINVWPPNAGSVRGSCDMASFSHRRSPER